VTPGRALPRWKTTVVAAVAVAVALCVAWLAWPARVPDFASVREQWRPSDAWLLDRHGVVIDQRRLDFDVRRLQWIALQDVSPALVTAIVDGEDRRYWRHGGVDWRSVGGAVRDSALDQRRRGASTITMQLAELLPQTRSPRGASPWQRKLHQVWAARGLESRWSKQQILEAYLNHLGFRGELQGIAAASALLAGKAPSGLDVDESRVLAALLPAPGARLDTVVKRACARIDATARATECARLRPVAAELLGRERVPLPEPALAPHVARQLLRVPGARVVSTLDGELQRFAQQALDRQLAHVADSNVRDGAVLVADVATGEVLAYVGSGGDASRSGEVDGVRALRQAGSTLKPFLYALAIERGYLTAASLLDDAPVALDTANGLYIPQNYDRVFRGPVSVRSALGNSLNVPAVRALVLTGVEEFRQRLQDAGYADITRDGDHYGYSLALGSAEVSPWQQAAAYRALARGGVVSPLRLLTVRSNTIEPPIEKASADVERQVISPAASFVVNDVLADSGARALTFGTDSPLQTRGWAAVKTGTSKDMRDNWCVGFSSRYVVAAWVGNFEGDSMRAVTGVTGAAPVWSEVMQELHRDEPSSAPVPPPGVESRLVRFEPAAEAARHEWFTTGTAVERVVAVPASAEIARIDSPANASVIALDPDIPPVAQRVPVTARGATAGMRLRLNGTVVGDAAQPVLWSPQPGRHDLTLEDDRGRTLDRVRFTVL
jgi:penicillin-binding protein 1C